MKVYMTILSMCSFFLACTQNSENMSTKDNAYWKENLSSEAYRVLREKGTEMAFTGKYYHFDKKGIYCCAGCNQPLFDSKHKYDSGSGWPSFYQSINSNAIKRVQDASHGMNRIEIVCSNCNGHLGHVFNDGPKPTGERHCVNSISLKFEDQ